MTTEESKTDEDVLHKTRTQTNRGIAHILVLENKAAHFFESTRVTGSLRHVSVITGTPEALTLEFGSTLFPRDEPYLLIFPAPPHNMDYRNRTGFLFLRPKSGKVFVFSRDAGPPNTYILNVTFINVEYEEGGQSATVNGTAEVEFVF